VAERLEAVVLLGMNPWQHREINDTVRFLARSAPGLDRVYLNPPAGLRVRPTAAELAAGCSWQEEEREGLTVLTRPLGFLPVALGLRAAADRLAAGWLDRRLAQRWGRDWRERTLVYVPSWCYTQTALIGSLRPRYLFFHLLDDTLGFPEIAGDPRVQQQNLRFLEAMLAACTVAAAVSPELAERYQQRFGRPIALLRNGVEAGFFAAARPAAELAALPAPRLLYTGSINSWVDLELLDGLAQARPDASLVLIGHLFADSVDRRQWQQLLSRPNVRWLGSRSYRELPAYLAGAEVLLLPRTGAEHSRASDPLKLYEYLASGRPVVSTALPALADFSNLVGLGGSPREFIAQVEAALRPHPELAQRQQAAVAAHSWEARWQELARLLENAAAISLTLRP